MQDLKILVTQKTADKWNTTVFSINLLKIKLGIFSLFSYHFYFIFKGAALVCSCV